MNAVLRILSKFTRNSSKGYVLILLCFLTPVMLLGARWVLEYANRDKIFKDMKVEKRCAREVAMAVATSMNPGLKFTDQKETLIRIADKIYNEYPAYGDVGNPDAVPGLQSPIYETKKKGKNYDPSVLGIKKYQSFSPKVKQVPYQEASKYVYRHASDETMSISEVFRRVYFLKKDSRVMDECAIIDLLPYINSDGENVNVYSYCSFHKGADTPEHISMKYLASSSSQQLQDPEYMERSDPNDSQVQIAIDNDRIWAKTDNDTAYAVPAECNVDIVITVPTNMAACNKDNSDDLPTVLSEDTQSVVSSDTLSNNAAIKNFRSTPIYQIAQAYHYFLQHFLHTRGTNVGLVPYSGKLSLPPDRAEEWSQPFPAFSWPDGEQNSYVHNLKGSFLYSTIGIKGTALDTPYETWGGYDLPEKHGGYGIMMRGNTLQEENYANNYICHGDLLDNSNPANYKFYRFNYNPCYITNISLMTMNSTEDSLQYCFNPYFVVELQADVAKIDDLMDVFVPFNDQNNNSNFTFLPLTWAHNLFQSWSKDPKQDSTTSSEEFYRESKTTAGRKKAVILIVNKPDWFEPNEMTYLGFDNDFSEMPFVESDCINFHTNFSDRSKKFADGSQYDGTIQGQKKILKFTGSNIKRNTSTGYYECINDGTATLTFPKRCLVKVVVEPLTGAFLWDYYPQALNPAGYSSCHSWTRVVGFSFAMACKNGRFAVVSWGNNPVSAYSNDGITWTRGGNPGSTKLQSMAASNSAFVAADNYGGGLSYSSDGINWTYTTSSGIHTGYIDDEIYWDGSRFFACTDSSVLYTTTVSNASSGWTSNGSSPRITDYEQFKYGGGYYVRKGKDTSNVLRSSTSINHSSYKSVTLPWSRNSALNYGNNLWVILTQYGDILQSSNASATSWSVVDGSISNTTSSDLYKISGKSNWVGICYGPHIKKWVAYTRSGDVAVSTTNDFDVKQHSIQFLNISNISNGCTTSDKYQQITARHAFYIEPSQLRGSDGNYSIKINLKNIRLISAEITNRPYERIKMACSFEGTTNGTGTAYIKTNAKEHISFDANLISSVQIYNSNGVSENVGTYSIAANGSKSLTFSGSNNFTSLTDGSRNIYNFSTSGGMNFGHNLSTQKLKYKLTHAQLDSATLKNQLLRWYAHYYLVSDNVNKKGIITANGHIGTVRNSTAEQYSDPCIHASYADYYNRQDGFTFYTASPQLAQVLAYNFHPACYGIRKGKFIFALWGMPASSVIAGDVYMSIKSDVKGWEPLNRNVNQFTNNEYQVVNFDGGNTTWVSIFTGRVKYRSKDNYTYGGTLWAAPTITTAFKYTSPVKETSTGCSSHFGTTCDGCAAVNCSFTLSCPSSYHYVGTIKNGDGTHTNSNGFKLTVNWHEHKMAWVTCTNGCHFDVTNAEKGCYKDISGSCSYNYDSAGNRSGNCNNEGLSLNHTGSEYTNYRCGINNFFFLSSEEKTLQGSVSSATDTRLLRNDGIYYSGTGEGTGDGWLYFCGDGNLEVLFSSLKSYLTYYDASGDAKKMEITVNQTFNFSPETHQYIKQSDGTYKIRLDIDGVQLSNVRFNPKLTDYTCKMKKVETPQFSGYARWDNGGSISTKNISHYTFGNMSYYSNKFAYCLKYNSSWNYLYYNYVGDFFMLVDDEDYMLNQGTDYWRVTPPTTPYFYNYLGSSLSLMFWPRKYMNSGCYKWDNILAAYPIPGIMCGITLPINTALYYGASGATDHVYEWQSARNGDWNETSCGDATFALKRLTFDAMQKLTNEYGSNLRIYVVLYRKQPGDYNYLFNNAFNVLEVDNEDDLKKVLEAVATEIKEWADYKEADFVKIENANFGSSGTEITDDGTIQGESTGNETSENGKSENGDMN